MSDSYRLIDTYSNDSGNLGTNWFGPQSHVSFQAPGTYTPWGSNFAVSSFDVGATFGTGSTDVLNSGGFGYDELDLTSLIAANPSGYSVTNAPVFNWGPGSPGFGCDTFSVSTGSGVLHYSDTLNSSAWGEIRDYEAVINASPYDGMNTVGISGFQNVNFQLSASISPIYVGIYNVQSGTFDLSNAEAEVHISTASDATQGSTQTYVFEAGAYGDYLSVVNGTQATDFAGNALVTDGHTSLLDFYDNDGGNTISLTASNINSNLYLNGGFDVSTTPHMSLIFSGVGTGSPLSASGIPTASSFGDDVVNLNHSGSGVANISTNDIGLTIVNGFDLGRDSLSLQLAGSGGFEINSVIFGSGSGATYGVAITDTSGQHGVVFSGFDVESLYGHMSTSGTSGDAFLNIH